jgi:dipeptidyl aminopeptidase/acylaminoacyl peptidase
MRKKKGDKKQIWMLSTEEGGKPIQVTDTETDILDFRWHPSGEKIAYIAKSEQTSKEKELKVKGYDFIFYEENLKHKNLYITEINRNGGPVPAEQLTKDITIWDFEFGPVGNYIAVTASEKNLIDQEYMFRKIYLLDLKNLIFNRISNNSGKLGNYAFSPDGSKIAYVAGIARNDHKQSQVYVMNSSGGNVKNLTIPNFVGHVNWVGWKDSRTVLYRSGEGTKMTLRTVDIIDQKRNVILDSDNSGIIFEEPNYSLNPEKYIFIANRHDVPGDLYSWEKGQDLRRLTTVNQWMSDRILGNQKVIKYQARDGMEVEGILIHPMDYDSKKLYPLIVYVHGGPESHYSNGWISSNTRPGQVMAGKGYVVFYPNYRASTGYGVNFSLEGYGDPAGKEFDDIADGIEYLIKEGIADPERVGMAGGSYKQHAWPWE